MGLAKHYRQAGMLDNAEGSYLEAIELHRGMSTANMGLVHGLQGLSDVYTAMGRADLAADTCGQAVEVHEHLADRGLALLKQAEKCEQLFKRADRAEEARIYEVKAERLRDVLAE